MIDILEVFTYNQHFVAMMNIINNARLRNINKGHKHHIIPRCWFKYKKLPIDNSKSNLIILSAEDHLKVHQLAALCAKEPYICCAMRAAVGLLNNGERPTGIHPTDETKLKISETVHKWYKVNMEEHIRKTKEGMKDVPYEKLAYWKGKKQSEESRQKASIGIIQKVNIAKQKYKEYKANGGELLWNEWRHLQYGRV